MKRIPETSVKITNLSPLFCFHSQKKNIYLTISSNFEFFYLLTIYFPSNNQFCQFMSTGIFLNFFAGRGQQLNFKEQHKNISFGLCFCNLFWIRLKGLMFFLMVVFHFKPSQIVHGGFCHVKIIFLIFLY